METQLKLLGIALFALAAVACSEDGGNGGAAGAGGTAGTGGTATSNVSGVVYSRDDAENPVEGVTVSVFGTNISTTTDASGQFTLESVPNGDNFFITEVSGAWGVVDYWEVPQETAGGVDFGVVPDSEIGAIAGALGRTVSESDGIVNVTFEGVSGGETASISAPSDPPVTFNAAGLPVEQDEVIAEEEDFGDLIYSSVDPADGPVTATVMGVQGVTDCFVDESEGTTYPILAKSITVVYASCVPAGP